MTGVERYLQCLGAQDWDGLAETISDERLRRDGPFCDVIEGKDAYVAFLRGIVPTLPGYELTVHRISAVSPSLAFVELSETFDLDGVRTEHPECLLFETDAADRVCHVSVFTKRPGAEPAVVGGKRVAGVTPTDLQRDILWSATVGPADFEERISAAEAAGYPAVSVSPADHQTMVASGGVAATVGRCADRGVALPVLDAVIDWYRYEPPKRLLASSSPSVEEFVAVAAEIGVSTATALAPYATTASIDELTASFAALCDRCAEVGVQVQLEFTPFPPVADLATAWRIVHDADRRNGGLMFDTWHYFRGSPDRALLQSIPGDRIFGVQLSDGDAELRESLVQDTYRHRRLPGEGSFDLVDTLAVLRANGGLRNAGPEVLSEALSEQCTPIEAASRAAVAFDGVAEQVNRR